MYDNQYHTVNLNDYSFLITGGAGFIGSNLVGYLLKYNAKRVVVLDNLCNGFIANLEEFKSDSRFTFIHGDITNVDDCREAMQGIDYVLHQAALGSVPRSIKKPLSSHNANATGLLNVMEVARNAGVKRLVFASSSSVYGDHPELPKVEENIGKPLSPYAVTKYAKELYAKVYYDTYGFETIGLRYFNVFGPKQNPELTYAAVIPLFAKAIINDQQPKVNGDGSQTRDFTFIENVIQANIKALFADKEAVGEVYNIGNGFQTSLLELVDTINTQLGKSIAPDFQPPRAGDIKDSLANISKAKRLIGYEPAFTFREGIKLTIDNYINMFSKN